MIRALVEKARDGKPLLLLGITDANVEMLRAGKPIYVSAASVDGLPVSVVIAHGASESQLLDELVRPHIGPDTRMRVDPQGERRG